MAKRAHTIIAEHFGMDGAEVNDNRYHYGHTAAPVYTIGDNYYAVGRKCPKLEGVQWSAIGHAEGRTIWEGLTIL